MHPMDNHNSIPAFLIKLWKLVNDDETKSLISWSKNGNTFVIKNQMLFSQKLLPLYYKHNNLASFIRQLNMYGFHKVMSVDSGIMRPENDEMEFSHKFFAKNRPDLLKNIRRKMPASKQGVDSPQDSTKFNKLVREIENLKECQDGLKSNLITMKNENKVLWREYTDMQQQMNKQNKIIQKLVHVLVSIYKGQGTPIIPKRNYTHLALEGGDEGDSASSSNAFERGLHSLIKDESGNPLTPKGPLIQEITGYEDSESNLEQVFSNMAAPTRRDIASNHINKNRRKMMIPQKSFKVISQDQPGRIYSGNSDIKNEGLASAAYGDFGQIIITENGAQDVFADEYTIDPLDINEELARIPVVQSPEGTVIQPSTPEHLMNAVDPSEVMPNIIIRPMGPFPNEAPPNHLSKTVLNSAPGTAQLSNNVYSSLTSSNVNSTAPSYSEQPYNSAPNKQEVRKPSKQVVINTPDGKVMNLKLASVSAHSPHLPVESSAPNTVTDVALRNTPISGDAMPDSVEDVQSLIDALQDECSPSRTISIDPSTLYSIFGDDFELLTNIGQMPKNQVSIYNPSNSVIKSSLHDPLGLDTEMPGGSSFVPQKAIAAIKKERNLDEDEQLSPRSSFQDLLNNFDSDSDELASSFGLPSSTPPQKKRKHIKIPKKGMKQENSDNNSLETPQIYMSPFNHADMFFSDQT